MATISFKNVDKIYDNNVQAVFDFNLEVKDKEFIVLVGPSGCGKSTTLRMLAGFEDISAGTISIDDKVINNLAPKDRDIAMVFQNYALYPHMTVYDNMAFALKLRRVPKIVYDENNNPVMVIDEKRISELEKKLEELSSSEGNEEEIQKVKDEIEEVKNNPVPKTVMAHYNKKEIEERIMDAAEILGLVPYLKRKPAALSGGQRQRVALGRAIVRTPKVFLMDEPLSNLDAKLRVQTRSEISKIHEKVGATTIYVTHDQTEAMTMADRIVIMKDGYIQQIGTPKEVYEKPSNIFVAGFIGSPSMNFFNGVFDGNNFKFENTDVSVELTAPQKELLKDYVGKKIIMGIRPEDFYTADDKSVENKSKALDITCDIAELLGYEILVYGYIGDQKITIKVSSKYNVENGQTLSYIYDADKVTFFDAETSLGIERESSVIQLPR